MTGTTRGTNPPPADDLRTFTVHTTGGDRGTAATTWSFILYARSSCDAAEQVTAHLDAEASKPCFWPSEDGRTAFTIASISEGIGQAEEPYLLSDMRHTIVWQLHASTPAHRFTFALHTLSYSDRERLSQTPQQWAVEMLTRAHGTTTSTPGLFHTATEHRGDWNVTFQQTATLVQWTGAHIADITSSIAASKD